MSKEKNYIFNEQAYLIWKLADRAFASLRTGGLINNDKGKLPLSLITGRYSPKTLISKAIKDEKLNVYRDFIDLEGYKLAALVPQIKLFKVEKNKYIPFYLPVSTEETTVSDVLHAHGGAHGVGIRGANLTFAGKDMFMRDKNIECSLSLYVQNLASIFKEPPPGYAKLADLFTISTKKYTALKEKNKKAVAIDQVANPTNFEIVMQIGYSIPDSSPDLSEEQKEKESDHVKAHFNSAEIAAIKGSTLSIRMTMHNHTISIQQDGSASIDIEYTGRLDLHLRDSFYDLMSNPVELLDLSGTKVSANELKLASFPASQNSSKVPDLQSKITQIQGLFTMRKYMDYLFHSVEANSRIRVLEVDDEGDYKKFLQNIKKKEKEDSVSPAPDPVTTPETNSKKNEERNLKKRNINYVFFGEILESVLFNVKKGFEEAQRLAVEEAKKATPDKKEILLQRASAIKEKIKNLQKFRILLTEVSVTVGNRPIRINIADIPVSLKIYCDFMFQRITQRSLKKFTLQQFLEDSVGFILSRSFNGHTASHAPALDSGINFKSMTITGPKLKSNTFKKTKIDVTKLPSFLRRVPSKTPKDDMEYHIMYGEIESSSPSGRGGELQEDIKDGVYHFHLGKDRGLLKTIDFQRDDVPYRKEALMTNAVSLYDELKFPYSATITMFGNNLFLPGSMLFINPASLGFGDPRNKKSAASRIGLGGYYQVISVQTSLDSSNSLTTVLNASFNNWADEALSLFGEMAETAKINRTEEAEKSRDQFSGTSSPAVSLGAKQEISTGEFYEGSTLLTPEQKTQITEYFRDSYNYLLPSVLPAGTRQINYTPGPGFYSVGQLGPDNRIVTLEDIPTIEEMGQEYVQDDGTLRIYQVYKEPTELRMSFVNMNGSVVSVKRKLDDSAGSIEFRPAPD